MSQRHISRSAPSQIHMIGRSEAFRTVEQLLHRIADIDAAVLIEGETGTGKELAARSIHYLGARSGMPFVPVNCGAIPDNLIENELFGHHRGAFTGAINTRHGLIGQAEGGTLFLDEVDALSPKGQTTLLRFMEDQEYRPLGCADTKCGNVRIIAASNANLAELSRSGIFRTDFLFRLKVLAVELPPLRKRTGDVELLAQHCLQKFSDRYGKPPKTLHPDTLAWMNGYDWPGNVRELEHLMHREFLLNEGAVINLHQEIRDSERRRGGDRRRVKVDVGFAEAKAQVIAEFERRYLEQLLKRSGGNITLAAKLASKERRALGKLIKKHGLERPLYS